MGFEYRGIARAGKPIAWESTCDVLDSLGELEIVSRQPGSVHFGFRELVRDRTTWPEDGSIELQPDGSIYAVFHVGPKPMFLERLRQSLERAGVLIEFEEL